MIESLKYWWDTIGNINKFLMAMTLVLFVAAGWFGTIQGERKTIRTSFCLERGYDGYKISAGKYYCWNTVNGEIKRFRDPVQ